MVAERALSNISTVVAYGGEQREINQWVSLNLLFLYREYIWDEEHNSGMVINIGSLLVNEHFLERKIFEQHNEGVNIARIWENKSRVHEKGSCLEPGNHTSWKSRTNFEFGLLNCFSFNRKLGKLRKQEWRISMLECSMSGVLHGAVFLMYTVCFLVGAWQIKKVSPFFDTTGELQNQFHKSARKSTVSIFFQAKC